MKRLIFLFLISSIISGCQYEFSEDYFKDIKVTQPLLNLNITNIKNDETLFKPRNIQYNYQGTERNKLLEIRFYIDNQLTQSFSQKSRTFFLDIQNLQDGTHTLKIEYFIKSGTGSLADLNNAESYKIEGAINFKINKSAIPLIIKRVEHKEGSIYVYFKPYELLDELDKSITATLIVYDDSDYQTRYITLTKEDLTKGFYNDTKAVKLNLKYKTKIENYYNSIESNIKKIKIEDTFTFKYDFIGDTELKLKWTQHPLYKNIPYFSFSYNNAGYNVLFTDEDTNGGEKVVNHNIGFGKGYNYTLTFDTEKSLGTGLYTIERKEGILYKGIHFFEGPIDTEYGNYPNIKNFIFNGSTNKIYSLEVKQDNYHPNLDNVYIYQYNSTNLNLENKILITKTKGGYGEIILDSNNDIILDLSEKSLVIDSNNLIVKKEYKGEDYQTIGYGSIVRYRKNALVVSFNNSINFYNPQTKIKFHSTLYEKNFSISNTGNYFSKWHHIYFKEGSTYTEVYDTGLLVYNTVFNEDANEIYIPVSRGDFFILNTQTKQKTTINNLPNIINVKHDKSTNTLLLQQPYGGGAKNIFFYNLDKKELKASKIYSSTDYHLLNNILLSKKGFYLKNNF